MTRVWGICLKVLLVSLLCTGLSLAAVVLDPEKVDRPTDDHRDPLKHPSATTPLTGGETSPEGGGSLGEAAHEGGAEETPGGTSAGPGDGKGKGTATPAPEETSVATTASQTPQLPDGREFPWSLIAVAVVLLLFAAGGGYYFYSNRDDD